MTLSAVGTLPLSEQIYQQLLGAILRAELVGTLPSERELAATFQVNRHAVREAVKRLQQARLVEVNQGGSTRVLTVHDNARLDLLPDLVVNRGPDDLSVARDVLEMRACVGSDAARLCALRSPAVGADLGSLVPDPAAAIADLELTGLAYWTVIIEGSSNLAFRLALNTLVAGIVALAESSPIGTQVIDLLHEEYRRTDDMHRLAAAIGDGNAAVAHELATTLLSGVVEGLRTTPANAHSG